MPTRNTIRKIIRGQENLALGKLGQLHWQIEKKNGKDEIQTEPTKEVNGGEHETQKTPNDDEPPHISAQVFQV